MKRVIIFLFLCVFSQTSLSAKLAGVDVSKSVTVGGKELQLNGAGIRTKFVFDIYVAALYTETAVKKVSDLVVDTSPMRMAMHFVYDEVSKEKLVDAWNEGFEDNLPKEKLNKLKSRIKLFNSLFKTVRSGDVILLDYVPAKGTIVTINNQVAGSVAGNEFYHALLLIWLGDEPVREDLKLALLGQAESDDE